MHDMDAERKGFSGTPCAPANPGGEEPAVVESRALLGDRQEVLIRHEGRLYRLRRTRLGKLILTA